MYEVRIRRDDNRLDITLSGALKAEELKAAVDDAISKMDELSEGFKTLSNISGLEPLGDEQLDEIRRFHQALALKRAGRLVRVIGQSKQAAVQIERISRTLGTEANLAFSLDEAERLLKGSVGR